MFTDQDLLYHSRVGLFISYIYALIGLFVGYTNVRLTFDLATKYSSCFDDICWGPVCRNVCVHLVIVWVVYIGEKPRYVGLLKVGRLLKTLKPTVRPVESIFCMSALK